jgi:hypothetical protein
MRGGCAAINGGRRSLFVLLLLRFTRRKSGICRRLFGLRSPPFVDDAKIPGCIVDGFVVEYYPPQLRFGLGCRQKRNLWWFAT